MNPTWRKHIAVWRNRLYLYPAPDAMPHTRLFWLATGLVTLAALLFAGYFIFYLTGRHDAYITSAEDLGIMDQAIWSTLHGHLFHQTICNIVSDTNCYSFNGISRFAIHFEPILFLVSLFYAVWPNPKTLLVIQSLVVASGAFPAFWLARLRLRNELAAVVIALLYLLYPAQQQATIYDFHAVTFTAALLLFTLYFLYTRRTAWLFVFAILSMACKEEIPLTIIIFGLWSILFQQRWRSGLALVLLAIGWIGLEYYIIHIYSPVGHPLLISRYASLGSSPLGIAKTLILHPVGVLRMYVFDSYHLLYLRILLSPAGYLPLLAPWVFILAVPGLAINLLSADPNMRSGFFQYNAEIVPVLIFSTIEAIVLILWVAQWSTGRLQAWQSKKASPAENSPSRTRYLGQWVHIVLLVAVLGFVMYDVVRADQVRGAMPFSAVNIDSFQGATQISPTFQWPQTNAHTELAQHFVDMIPASASVSAQSHLVPHISQRLNIYLFPYADDRANYIFLDVTGNTYPLVSYLYKHEVKKVLLSGDYGIVAAQDGYLLLKRGLPAPGISPYSPYGGSSDVSNLLPDLPATFCSFVHVAPQQVQHPLQATFTSTSTSAAGSASMNLVGLSAVYPRVFSLNAGSIQITTYWKVSAPTPFPVQLLALVIDKNGKNHFATNDFPAASWCPTNTWQPGATISVVSDLFLLRGIPKGLAHISLALLPVTHPFSTIMDEQSWFSLKTVNGSGVSTQETRTLQVATVSIVP
ncbi:MAG: DUF2079 domain-containing protein [Ktedonobacteraceae bacterium]